MKKKIIYSTILILLLLQANCQDIEKLEEFNDLLKILYKSKVVILFFINEKNNESLQYLNEINSFVNDQKLDYYYQVAFSTCENFEEFCEMENIAKNENSIFITKLHQYDKFVSNRENLEKLKTQITIDIGEIQENQELEDLKNFPNSEMSILFNFQEYDSIVQGKIDSTIKKCVSNCFKSHLIKRYRKINTANFPKDHFLNKEENLNRIFIVQNKELIKLKSEDFLPEEVISSINIETSDNVIDLDFSTYMKILSHPIQNKIYLIEKGHECPDIEKHFEEASIHNKNEDLFSQRLLFVRIDLKENENISDNDLNSSNRFIESLVGEEERSRNNCVI